MGATKGARWSCNCHAAALQNLRTGVVQHHCITLSTQQLNLVVVGQKTRAASVVTVYHCSILDADAALCHQFAQGDYAVGQPRHAQQTCKRVVEHDAATLVICAPSRMY